MSIGTYLESLSQAILAGIILVGKLGASVGLLRALPGTVGLHTARRVESIHSSTAHVHRLPEQKEDDGAVRNYARKL